MRFSFALITIMVCNVLLKAQDKSELINVILEKLTENIESDVDYMDLQTQIEALVLQPVPINTADAETLTFFGLLSPEQALAIINYRKFNGNILHAYELSLIRTLDLATVQLLKILITFQLPPPPQKPKQQLKYGKHEIISRINYRVQKADGFTRADTALLPGSNNYTGKNRFRNYNRWVFTAGNLFSAGITAEQDPGEPFGQGKNKYGFDFYSAHLFITPHQKWISKIALGDFHASYGQGLTLATGLSFGKSAMVLSTKKYNRGLRAFRSSLEYNFYRGAGIGLKHKNWEWELFYSRKQIDGNTANQSFTDNESATFSSFKNTGYHRTPNELAGKNTVLQQVAGTNLQYSANTFKAGVVAVHQNYAPSYLPQSRPDNKFAFRGNEFQRYGSYYDFYLKGINLYGEHSISNNLGHGHIIGIIKHLNSYADLNMVFRHYTKDYYALQTAAFGENGKNQNETGLYSAIELRLSPKWKLMGYLDYYRFNFFRFQTHSPTEGRDILLELKHVLSPNTFCYWRYKNDRKEQTHTVEYQANAVLTGDQTEKLRFHIRHKLSSQWRSDHRLEVSRFQNEINPVTWGYLLFQDLRYVGKNEKLTATARLAFFDVAHFNARLYAYENDVLYAFSVPAYYGSGLRAYLLFKYQVSPKLSFWMRAAQWVYEQKDEVGSGLQKTKGNQRTDFSFQLRWKI